MFLLNPNEEYIVEAHKESLKRFLQQEKYCMNPIKFPPARVVENVGICSEAYEWIMPSTIDVTDAVKRLF